jgi:hypothetical protein
VNHVCVSNDIEGTSPIFNFWAEQKLELFILNPAQVHAYVKKEGLPGPSAVAVANICANMFKKKP